MPCPSESVRNALGRPGEGGHAWRIPLGPNFDVAGVDVLLTAGIAALIARALPKRKNRLLAFFIIFVILILAAVGIHRAFCVNTALNKKLGLGVPEA
jgi:hypothetical protein